MDYICVRSNDCYNHIIEVKAKLCDTRSTCRECALSGEQGCSLLKALLCFVDMDKLYKERCS